MTNSTSMHRSCAEDIIIAIISEVLALNVNLGSKLEDFSEWDSMAQFIILTRIESHFEIQFRLEDLQNVSSVHEWINATKKATKERV